MPGHAVERIKVVIDGVKAFYVGSIIYRIRIATEK